MFSLPEQLIINHVEELFSQLNELLTSGDEVKLDISNVRKTDTACLQLLCAVQKNLNDTGHQIIWHGQSDALCSTAKMIGVDQFLQL